MSTGMNPQALQQWATEGAHDDQPADDGTSEEGHEGTPEHCQLWAGEHHGEVTADDAAECMTWLMEHEPQIYDAVTELAMAHVSGDESMVEHAEEELKAAPQQVEEGYPDFSEEERQALIDLLPGCLDEAGDPDPSSDEFSIAVADCLSEVRTGEEHEGGEEEHHEEEGEEHEEEGGEHGGEEGGGEQ